ncbi:MAG: hypothetical protein WA324_15630 [Bryobacteraceae bacterium]
MIHQFSHQSSCSLEELSNASGCRSACVDPALLADLIHEVRQPLSTIECLAYYLELTSEDEGVRQQMQRIQELIWQANGILENSWAESPAH